VTAPIEQTRIWDDASSPPCDSLVRRFVADWRSGQAGVRNLASYLPNDPDFRPAALLALLRADLALRRQAGEEACVELYLKGFPDLTPNVLVALLYEEYCLRERAGETVDPREYERRFPAIATEVHDLIDIHKFVDSSKDLLFGAANGQDDAPFPRPGETIGGFRLVEELGRGRIARVYLALERHLADRPVALKVSRMGSREPQTLALLQHTHIVPVHSYHLDVVTDLHLLCMPYFGRVTLADILTRPKIKFAKTGADLLAVLDQVGQVVNPREHAEGRAALRELSFAQAIAWWGARLAEALQYAHDCGVLHHDIKPSNVLVTADARPMLLDFNLARPSGPDGRRLSDIGGTLAYMAPEHLDAVTGTSDDPTTAHTRVDGRADIYSLGVLLYEALGSPPSAPANGAGTRDEVMRAIFAAPTAPSSRLKLGTGGRNIPAALGAVVTRCLEPERANRYASAAELAADLQAVADNAPLRFAREPEPSRTFRRLWRNRRVLAAVLGLIALAVGLMTWQTATLKREATARRELEAGIRLVSAGEFTAAAAQFGRAFDRASTGGSRALRLLAQEAEERRDHAIASGLVRDRVQAFFKKVEPIRYRLITGQELSSASNELKDELAKFHVFGPTPWTNDFELNRLDPAQRVRLIEEINEVLFLWVMASDEPGDKERARRAAAMCEHALSFAEPKGPWHVLKARYDGRPLQSAHLPACETDRSSARACFQWGLLALLDGQPQPAIAWFERAVNLRPDQFWYQFALAYHHSLYGDATQAMAHYDAALALRPDSSWVLLNRGQLAWSRLGAWERARLDLEQARAHPEGLDPRLLVLELGRMAERVGDYPSALAHFENVIRASTDSDLTRRARLNRAQVEVKIGPLGPTRAWARLEQLIKEEPNDTAARHGHALVALRTGRPEIAEVDLSYLLTNGSAEPLDSATRGQWLATRALARLLLNRTAEGASDADEAFRVAPSPGRLRVRLRLAIAAGRVRELADLDLDDIDRLPAGGRMLAADLQRVAAQGRFTLDRRAANALTAAELTASKTQTTTLSALNDHAAALVGADRLIALDPLAVDSRRLRAMVRRRASDLAGAKADVVSALELAPGDTRLQTLLARLLIDQGQPAIALSAIDRALAAGATERAHAVKAQALAELARYQDAIPEWTAVLRHDSEDAEAFLGRSQCFAKLGFWDPALADLESAIDWSNGRPAVLKEAFSVYASCLQQVPNRLSRVLDLAILSLIANANG
jgi:serine/threonine protein kinase/Tfp pilus assembly protein PilF